MAWFRFYEEVLDDPKIQRLPPDIFKSWVNILCLAKRHGGLLPSYSDIAFSLRITDGETIRLIEDLKGFGLLDKTKKGFEPHNWRGRQYASDNSMERVNRYRAKRRASGLPILADYSRFRPALIERDGEECIYCGATKNLVVDHLVPIAHGGTDDTDNLGLACKQCNSGKAGRTPELAGMSILIPSAVTALQRYRDSHAIVTVTATPPEQNRTEAEAETEVKRVVPPKKRARNKSYIPEDWMATAEHISWAREQAEKAGVEIEWYLEADQFVDHHRKVGSIFVDWKAAWRTWVRNAIKFKLEKPHGNQHRGNGKPSAHDTMLAAHAFAATSRPDAGTGEDIPPDGRGKGDAGKPAASVPRLPSARRAD